jgi:hypothetical protein
MPNGAVVGDTVAVFVLRLAERGVNQSMAAVAVAVVAQSVPAMPPVQAQRVVHLEVLATGL